MEPRTDVSLWTCQQRRNNREMPRIAAKYPPKQPGRMTVLRRTLYYDDIEDLPPLIEGNDHQLRQAVTEVFGQRPIRVANARPYDDPFGYACFAFETKADAALFKLRHGGELLIEGTD